MPDYDIEIYWMEPEDYAAMVAAEEAAERRLREVFENDPDRDAWRYARDE